MFKAQIHIKEESMKYWTNTKWIFLLSVFLILLPVCAVLMIVGDSEAQRGKVGTQTCINCHQTWLDNDPSVEDVLSGAVRADYFPVNLVSTRSGNPFYTIPEGYVSSLHYTPSFDTNAKDHVTCEHCHGSGLSHYGVGAIRFPIPDAKTCGACHNETHPTKPFNLSDYFLTSHANSNRKPGKYFDQLVNGTGSARVTVDSEFVSLFKSGQLTMVTRNERIEECSVCHNYALQYPTFKKKIAQGNLPNPQVSCGACHNSHIIGPGGNQPAVVDTTVKVTGLSGSVVTAVAPVQGRNVYYVNNKPYKINAEGAQDTLYGTWTRGSAFNQPQPIVIKGIGVIENTSDGIANRFKYMTGGFFASNPGETLFISGKATATVNLPSDAIHAGAPVTVEATLDRAGFLIGEVKTDVNIILGTFDQTLILETREDPARNELIAQLGTDKIGIVVKVPVTYRKTAGGTGTLNVFVPFSGEVSFEVRNMKTNTETLCQSCHTQGKQKYTAWGKKKNGTFVDLSSTHNNNVGGQYRRSGHANQEALAFKEFSAFEYASTHQPTYPFNMSITGSGGLDSLRNKSNTSYQLTQTPNPTNAYLGTVNNTRQVVLINNYVCNQCHHGLGSIDYMKSRQGTPDAQVLWGDATVTCLTCHETHKDSNGSGKNLRVPVKLSFNSQFVDAGKNPGGGFNGFMDGTAIPTAAGNGQLCLFCHQGRESGLTVYYRIIDRLDPYTNPDQVINPAGFSFVNPHYLDGGSHLWSRNAWEYFFNNVPQQYTTGNTSHQGLNCAGCHMGEANADHTQGGHTWKPRIETCRSCHPGAIGFFAIPSSADYDGDGQTKTTYEELGTINPDSGLFGQLKAALELKGIFFNPDSYPYYFTSTGNQFRAWTTHTLSAAFNLAWAYKARNAASIHNSKYIVQILQDSMRGLGVVPKGIRPAGNRPATDYRVVINNINP
jgi:hypothetical protein